MHRFSGIICTVGKLRKGDTLKAETFLPGFSATRGQRNSDREQKRVLVVNNSLHLLEEVVGVQDVERCDHWRNSSNKVISTQRGVESFSVSYNICQTNSAL